MKQMLRQINVIRMLQIHQNQNVAVIVLTVTTSGDCNSRYVKKESSICNLFLSVVLCQTLMLLKLVC